MAGKVTELTSKNFDAFIKGDKVAVDFYAEWCGPCKVMSPLFDEAAKELKDKVKFGKVNVDENPKLAQRFQVMSIPTIILFKNKQQVDRAIGLITKDDLIKRLKEIK